MSLFGYNLTTTPKLRCRYHNDKLFVFPDLIYGYSGTNQSLQLMLTFLRQNELGLWYTKMNLFELLKTAGYFWDGISNEEILWGERLDPARVSAHTYTKEFYVRGKQQNGTKLSPYDESLWYFLDMVLRYTNPPASHLIPLFGCHFNYSSRYPRQFSGFSAKFDPRRSILTRAKLKLSLTMQCYIEILLYTQLFVNMKRRKLLFYLLKLVRKCIKLKMQYILVMTDAHEVSIC